MCEPTSIMVGLTALSTVLAVKGQQEMAKQQEDSIEESARLSNETTQKQYNQIQEQNTDEVSQVARAAMVEQARMRVAAGEAGIAGNTVDAAMGNSEFNAAEAIAGIGKNTRNNLSQSYLNARAGDAQYKSQMNSIKQPDWVGAGLQIAGSVAGNYNSMKAGWTGSQAPAPVEERSFNR